MQIGRNARKSFFRKIQLLQKHIPAMFERTGIEERCRISIANHDKSGNITAAVLLHQFIQQRQSVLHHLKTVTRQLKARIQGLKLLLDIIKFESGRIDPGRKFLSLRYIAGKFQEKTLGLAKRGVNGHQLIPGRRKQRLQLAESFLDLLSIGKLFLLTLQFLEFPVSKLRRIQLAELGLVEIPFLLQGSESVLQLAEFGFKSIDPVICIGTSREQ